MNRTHKLLYAIAGIAFVYAVVGNYVALPGYLRFLDRGGTSAAGNSLDIAVVIGATKTVLWMLSFAQGFPGSRHVDWLMLADFLGVA
jgi:hypothetical protein